MLCHNAVHADVQLVHQRAHFTESYKILDEINSVGEQWRSHSVVLVCVCV